MRDPERRAQRGQSGDTEARWATWQAIQSKTLLIRGANSDILDRDIAIRMQDKLAGSQLVEIPNAGHLVPGDNPLEFEKALDAFLYQIETGQLRKNPQPCCNFLTETKILS